jgi:hypothetical protein
VLVELEGTTPNDVQLLRSGNMVSAEKHFYFSHAFYGKVLMPYADIIRGRIPA